jgi:uncharacterized protein with von Willebrand factor type A (vWA) domain
MNNPYNNPEDLKNINPLVTEENISEEVMEEQPEEINWEAKCELLKNNLNSAYAKIRQLEKQLSERALRERSSDMLISQAVSVLSNTVMLSIKNKEN